MARNLYQRNGVYILRKTLDGKEYRRSTGFRQRNAAERRAAEIELERRQWAGPLRRSSPSRSGSSGIDDPTA